MQGQGQVLKFDPSGVLRTRINITVFYLFIWLFVPIYLYLRCCLWVSASPHDLYIVVPEQHYHLANKYEDIVFDETI